MQHLSILRVAEGHVLKSYRTFGGFDLDRVRRIDDVVFAIQHFEAAFRSRGCAFHCPRRVGDRFKRLIKHQEVGAENQQRSKCERAGKNVQRSDVIHRGRSKNHQRADHKRAIHVRQRQTEVCLQTLLGLLMKLHDFELLTTERVHHSNRAQAFLRLGEDGAFLFLNECRLTADAVREEINRRDDERDDS